LTSFPPIPLLSLPTSPYPRKQVFGRRERGFPPWKRPAVRVDDGSLHYIKTFKTPKDDIFFLPTLSFIWFDRKILYLTL